MSSLPNSRKRRSALIPDDFKDVRKVRKNHVWSDKLIDNELSCEISQMTFTKNEIKDLDDVDPCGSSANLIITRQPETYDIYSTLDETSIVHEENDKSKSTKRKKRSIRRKSSLENEHKILWKLATELNESNTDVLSRCLKYAGRKICLDTLDETLHAEERGGMFDSESTNKKITSGQMFLQFIKLRVDKQTELHIFCDP
ncbi:hypothetical protein GJ496_000713 [Pomphorhynchus laevis]|nr:hypothetical protein GJ496_000713 [Pomphorhynchus laevis]